MAAKVKYVYRYGYKGYKKIKPEILWNRLENLRAKYKRLTPELILQHAKNPNDILHQAFPWNNKEAAHEHRLDMARRMIRSVQIIRIDQPKEPPRTVYVHVPDEAGGEYAPMETVVQNLDMYEAALGGLQIKLSGAKRSYEELTHYASDSTRRRKVQNIGKHIRRAVSAARAS